MKRLRYSLPILLLLLTTGMAISPALASSPNYNINTLAGKVAAVDGAAGLHIGMSDFVQQEAAADSPTTTSPTCTIGTLCTPVNVLSSPLDPTSVASPDVTVNQDTAAAPQNEPAIAVNPNNPDQIVAGSNDYVTRTWTCMISGTPCSELGDGYSGTYFSNDGGLTWCCLATDPSNIGTLIPGVEHLVGGSYDAGGDPALAFDASGNVFYVGLGFDRTSPPNTVEVSSGTFSTAGGSTTLTWGSPTFIAATTSPSVFNDKPWLGVDSHPTSPFANNVYVSWTRFIFNPFTGAYRQSPISFVYSTDGGKSFSTPQLISGNVLYGQGSHIVVGPDGTVYVFWDGSTRLASLDSIYMVKSTDGGRTFSSPVAVSTLVDIPTPQYTQFRDNSFPAADITPAGELYVAWSTEVTNGQVTPDVSTSCAYFIVGTSAVYSSCHSAVVYSTSADGGTTWSTPAYAFAQGARSNAGYPVTQPDGTAFNAPPSTPIDSLFPAVAASSSGEVYISAYQVDINSPWQTCASPGTPTSVGRIDCLTLGNYINNGRLDYVVTDLASGKTETVSTNPINSQYQFGGGFIGDYTGIAAGSDGSFHAVWTDTGNVQTVVWWYGYDFSLTPIHQQDIVTASGNF
ncbi:MAG: exo-alpha-sialidase [Thaumarchaeota archaeon]|nr:exo-alpha-sialidase [Nitrososphaerota archaeon]